MSLFAKDAPEAGLFMRLALTITSGLTLHPVTISCLSSGDSSCDKRSVEDWLRNCQNIVMEFAKGQRSRWKVAKLDQFACSLRKQATMSNLEHVRNTNLIRLQNFRRDVSRYVSQRTTKEFQMHPEFSYGDQKHSCASAAILSA